MTTRFDRIRRYVLAAAAGLLLTGCGGVHVPPVVPPVDHTAEWTATCRAVVQEQRQREITEVELSACLAVAHAGGHVEQLRAWCDALPPEPDPPIESLDPAQIRIDGRFFVTDSAGTFRPRFASALSILARPPPERAAVLDEYVALGFNGVRVFGGDLLPWSTQTPASARATLPAVIDEARVRGLYVYVSALTGTATGYDAGAHLRAVATICADAANCLLEIANEPYHHTQSAEVQDPVSLLRLAWRAVPEGVPYALGPAPDDEPDAAGHYATDGGGFNTAHLARGRDKWNQVRRVREIENISVATRKPVMSGEPIGAAETSQPGRRESDPSFFFAMGALCRGFEIGCVFHSEDGLYARLLGPNQRACAEAFIAGWRAIDTDARLSFKNATWSDSPIKGADFSQVVRAYSFVAGDQGWLVLVGLTGDPPIELQLGWQLGIVIAERPGVQVRRLER